MNRQNEHNSNTNLLEQTSESELEENRKEASELINLVDQNIESIVDLHMHAEHSASYHQRAIEKFTANLGRPRFFYFILLFVAAWMVFNLLAPFVGISRFDSPPFPALQTVISLGALLMTTVVLITQNRQEKLADQRRHLDLQVNLVVEQKVTKLINLIDELRKDSPIAENHDDPQVEAMKETLNPHTVISSLHESLNDASQQGKR